jgi:hypothetical protein
VIAITRGQTITLRPAALPFAEMIEAGNEGHHKINYLGDTPPVGPGSAGDYQQSRPPTWTA